MNKNTITRSVTFPIASPGVPWEEFRDVVRASWRKSTRLANWAVTELAKADKPRKPSDTKLGKPTWGGNYLYQQFGKYFDRAAWDGGTSSAQSLMRAVEQKYRKERIDVIWRCAASLPRYRYPYPYPIHNQCWSASINGNIPVVRMTIGGTKFNLRLRGGPQFKRQLEGLRDIVTGKAKKCAAAIYQKGDHIMVKLVGEFPPKQPKSGRTILVRTDPNAFFVYEIEGLPAKIINADHVRRWVAEHKAYRQRMSEDLKYEKRWPQNVRNNIRKSLDARCEKMKNRLHSWCHMATAMLVGFAERQGVSELIYDDSCQTYLESFPWHELKGKLSYKCNGVGINFTHKDGTEANRKDDVCTVTEALEQNRMVRRLARAVSRGPCKSHGKVSATRPSTNGSDRQPQLTS